MMNEAARGPGRTVTWSNAESGSHGTAKPAAMRKNCACLQQFVYAKTAGWSREIRVHLCREADGKWLMYT